MATNIILKKQPNETRIYDIDFSKKMRTGETIVSVDSVTSVPVDDIVSNTTSFSGQVAQISLSGGLQPIRPDYTENQYKITIIVTTSAGQILENDGTLIVSDE